MKLKTPTSAKFDTSTTLNIKSSIPKILGIIVIGFVFLGGAVWLILGGAVEKMGELTIIIGWAGAILCAITLPIRFQRLFFSANVRLVLTPRGLLDTRAFASEIPWSVLTGISKWTYQGTSLLLIEMRSDDFDKLELTRVVRIGRSGNKKMLGRDCIPISSSDLNISFADLETAIKAYALAHNPAIGIYDG